MRITHLDDNAHTLPQGSVVPERTVLGGESHERQSKRTSEECAGATGSPEGAVAGTQESLAAALSAPLLSAEHRHLLQVESRISDDVIEERGYFSITKSGALRLGFKSGACNGMAIPTWNTQGKLDGCQIRRNEPRVKSHGKLQRYESLPGRAPTIDCHPRNTERLGNPAFPLFLNEGVKKADSLASRGALAISIPGVFGWRGTNQHGEVTALACWEDIAIKSRKIYLCFDSDVMSNSQVHQALRRLRSFLLARGASHVYTIDGDTLLGGDCYGN
jgi:hypothetical protein